MVGQEEDEDDWEEGEINGNDETHENSNVPESEIHGKNVDGDKLEDEGKVVSSRPNSEPNDVDVQNGEKNDNLDRNGDHRPDPTQSQVGGASDGIDLDSVKNKSKQAQIHEIGSSGCQGGEGHAESFYHVGASNDEDRSVHGTLDIDGADSSHSIDLNSEPMDIYDWHDIDEEEVLRRGRAKKSKSKDKRSKKQGIAKYSTFPVTMKPKDIFKANAYRKNKKHNPATKMNQARISRRIRLPSLRKLSRPKMWGRRSGFRLKVSMR
ncbi:hypothetical protein L2E82_50438 [Cichorium intybus]|nr:hypothetical protein L2E82_50438 [Cichorium intybus]